MKKSFIILMVIILAASLVAFGYYSLGGFRPVELSLEDCTDLVLVGKEFRGIPQDEKLSMSFKEVEAIKLNTSGAVLHTIYYAEPEGKLDTMHVFVGIQNSVLSKPTPELLERRVICRQAVVARISAHRFVMPSPIRIKRKIAEYAAKHGVVLQELFIDKLLDDSHVEVWAPVIAG